MAWPQKQRGGGMIETSQRQRLPNRRQSESLTLEFENQQFEIGIGYFPDGTPGETFARCTKPGSQLDCLLDDAATLISISLQRGITPSQLGKSLGRAGPAGPRSSILGCIVDALAEHGEGVGND